jgi:hypothetical protein
VKLVVQNVDVQIVGIKSNTIETFLYRKKEMLAAIVKKSNAPKSIVSVMQMELNVVNHAIAHNAKTVDLFLYYFSLQNKMF